MMEITMEMANTRTPSAKARSTRKVPAVSRRMRSPKRRAHQFIRGIKFAAEIRGQKQRRNRHAGQQVPQHQLQESEIVLETRAVAFR